MRRTPSSEWLIDALALRVSTDNDLPLAQQLYTTLRGWIQGGELEAGRPLPSSRRLSKALNISRNTVLAAMDRLLAEGLVVSRRGSGLYVATLPLLALPAAPPAAEVVEYSTRGLALIDRCATLSSQHTAFAPGIPALDLFPHAQWQRLLRRHFHQADTAWLAYQTLGGLPALKEALCDYLTLSRAVRCRPEQIVITQGAQQAFELIVQLLTDSGENVWMEEPGYGGAQTAFATAGLSITPIPVDENGMNPALGPASGVSPRLIYVTPSHQYPSGVTMPVPRRLALLEHAAHHGAWIIEDDYDSEFRYDTPPVPSLQGLAERAAVIYVGTFSKVLYPGLRLGYLVLPDALADTFRLAHARLHREGHYPAQSALAEFIAKGHFSRHIARMRGRYRLRQACLRKALAPAIAQGLKLSSGHAGMHLVAELESAAQERALIEQSHAEGITLSPLSRYYLGQPQRFGLVLGYAGATEDELSTAGHWLGHAWLRLQGGGN
ncbi:PLP-dependent aminotransferase family protein [Halomonas aquamarina]|uniref:PLP-dependent aminotransferase family protein n=1 Tax=Vreelandella aquamarina TaxID=77097 RepID=A0ACC5VXE5_9GAMM|nr:PLP-dependent aminotransferase family protein [Halomonas aquamarina]MBZ5488466.1 PLP-dependent aminotransferase family protein [Halomonas aquamarina]